MNSYELHEFDHNNIVSKKAKPDLVVSTNYTPYTENESGLVVIDKNSDLTFQRNLISLTTTRPTQLNVERVIDIDFQEFVPRTSDTVSSFLQAKINDLEAERARLLSEKSLDAERLESLKAQIRSLQNQLLAKPDTTVTENEVPDTLTANGILYSDRTGLPGAPAAPLIQNKLLSKNRKAVAVMQTDGNFAIYKGEFDTQGNQISGTNTEVVFGKGWNSGATEPSYMRLTVDDVDAIKVSSSQERGAYIEVGSAQSGRFVVSSGPSTVGPRYTSDVIPVQENSVFKVVLDDNGILNMYDRATLVWTSFGK